MPDIKQSLKDFVATSNSGKYATEEELMSKFPELKGYDIQILKDFVATSNSGKYNNEDELFSKFPEFNLKKKDESQPTFQEDVTESITKDETTPTLSESSESKFDYEKFLDKDEEEAIYDLQKKLTGKGYSIEETGIGNALLVTDNITGEQTEIDLKPIEFFKGTRFAGDTNKRAEEIDKVKKLIETPSDSKRALLSANKIESFYSSIGNNDIENDSFVSDLKNTYSNFDFELYYDPIRNGKVLRASKGDVVNEFELQNSYESPEKTFSKINSFLYNNMSEEEASEINKIKKVDELKRLENDLNNIDNTVDISMESAEAGFYNENYFKGLFGALESAGVSVPQEAKTELEGGVKIDGYDPKLDKMMTSDFDKTDIEAGIQKYFGDNPEVMEKIKQYNLVGTINVRKQKIQRAKKLATEVYYENRPDRESAKEIILQAQKDLNEAELEITTNVEMFRNDLQKLIDGVDVELDEISKKNPGVKIEKIVDEEGVLQDIISSEPIEDLELLKNRINNTLTSYVTLVSKSKYDLDKINSKKETTDQFIEAADRNYNLLDIALADLKNATIQLGGGLAIVETLAEGAIEDVTGTPVSLGGGLPISSDVKMDMIRSEMSESREKVEKFYKTKRTYNEAISEGSKLEFGARTIAEQTPNIVLAIGTSGAGSSIGLSEATVSTLIATQFGITSAGQKYDELTTRQEFGKIAEQGLKELESIKDFISEDDYLNQKYELERAIKDSNISATDKTLSVIGTGIIEGTVTRFLGTAPNSIKVLKDLKAPNNFMDDILRSNYKATLQATKEFGKRTGGEIIEETSIDLLTQINDYAFLGDQIDLSSLDDVAVTSIITSGAMNTPSTAYSTILTQINVNRYKSKINSLTNEIGKLKEVLMDSDLTDTQRSSIHDLINNLTSDVASETTNMEGDALLLGSENIKNLLTLSGIRQSMLKKAGVENDDSYEVANAKIDNYLKGLDKDAANKFTEKMKYVDDSRNKIIDAIDYEGAVEKVFGEKGTKIAEGLDDKLTPQQKYVEVYKQIRQEINDNAKKEFDAIQEQKTGSISDAKPAEGVQEMETEVREPFITEKKKEKVSDAINRPITLTELGGSTLDSPIEGDLYVDGQQVVVEDSEGNITEIGNVDKISDSTLEDLGIVPQESNVKTDSQGNLVVGDDTLVPDRKGIKRDKRGNISRVELRSPDGSITRTLRGANAEDAAYQILLNEAQSTEQEQRINELLEQDEEFQNELRQAEEASETEADKDTTEATGTKEEYVKELKETIDTDPVVQEYLDELNKYRRAKTKNAYDLDEKKITQDQYEAENKRLNQELTATQKRLKMNNKKAGIVTRNENWDKKIKENLPESNISTSEDLNKKLEEGTWGMLTAENPNADIVTDKQNENANKRAEKWLKSKGYSFTKIFGKYGNSEQSYLVDGLTREDAIEFAKEFSQESVATNEGLVYQDGSMNPKVGQSVNINEKDLYSTIKTSDGLVDFKVEYDFSQRTKPTTSNKGLSKLRAAFSQKQIGVGKVNDVTKKTNIEGKAENARKSLAKLLPNVKINTYYNENDYHNAIGVNDKSRGTYSNGVIHINLTRATDTTVAHEVFHALLFDRLGSDAKIQALTKRFVESLSRSQDPRLIQAFADSVYSIEEYKGVENEEIMAELFGTLAGEYKKLKPETKSLIKRFLERVANMLGLKKFTDAEVIDVLNTLAGKIATGQEITTEDVNIIEDEQGMSGAVGVFKVPSKKAVKAPLISEDTRDFANLLDQVDIREFEGQPFISNMYDYTTAGKVDLENGLSITLFGGKNYVPYMMKLKNLSIGDVSNLAAFNTKAQAETFIRNSVQGKANLFAPHAGGLATSWQFQQKIFEELMNLIIDNKLVSKSSLIQSFNKGLKDTKGNFISPFEVFRRKLNKNIKNLSGFKANPKELVEFLSIEKNFSPDLRKRLVDILISNKDFQKAIGIKNKNDFYNLIMDPMNKGVVGGEIMGIIKFDPNTFEIKKTKKGDIDHHESFGYTLLAKIEGIYQPTEFHKSYDITDSFTKYNKNETLVSTKENPNFIQANVLSSAGSIPKVGVFTSPKKQVSQRPSIEEVVKESYNLGVSNVDTNKFLSELGYTKEEIAKFRENEEDMYKKTGNKVLDWLKKSKIYLTSARAFLPKNVFIAKENKDSAISTEIAVAERAAKRLNKALKNQPDSVYDEVNKLMKGERFDLPKDIAILAKEMREHIDSLSQKLIDSGAVKSSDSMDNIRKNLGSYLNRSFRVFDDKNWSKKVSEKVVNQAKEYIKNSWYQNEYKLEQAKIEAENENMTVDEWIDEKSEQEVNEILNKEDANSFVKSAIEGSKNIKVLKQRKDIPAEILALMGEYNDPSYNYVMSVAKIVNIVENQKYLEKIKDIGEGVFLFKKEQIKRGDPTNYVQISAESNESLAPLNGYYAPKEFVDQMKRENLIDIKDSWFKTLYRGWLKAVGSVKKLKTIYSLGTHGKNVFGNARFMAQNGYVNPKDYNNAYKLLRNEFRKKGDEDLSRKLDEYRRLGVINQNIGLNELKSMFSGDDSFDIRIEKRTTKQTESKFKKVGKKVDQFVEDLYQAEDDLFKIVAYENEKRDYADIMFDKPYEDLTDSEKKKVDDRVSNIVKNILPNYSRLGGLAKGIKYIPVTGTFISFQLEAYRTAWNTVNLALNEIKSDNSKLRSKGSKRLASLILVEGIKQSLLYFLGTSFLGDDEEEKIKANDVRPFLPEYAKNSDIIVINNEPGKFTYLNLSGSDPFGGIFQIINAASRGESFSESVTGMLKEFGDPVLSQDIFLSSIDDIIRNKNNYGGNLYEDSDTFFEKSGKTLERLYKAFEPGTLTSIRKIAKKKSLSGMFYEGIGQFTGVKPIDVDVSMIMNYKIKDAKESIDNIKKQEYRAEYKAIEENSIGDLFDVYKEVDNKLLPVYEKYNNTINKAMRLGVPITDIDKMMSSKRFSNDDASMMLFYDSFKSSLED